MHVGQSPFSKSALIKNKTKSGLFKENSKYKTVDKTKDLRNKSAYTPAVAENNPITVTALHFVLFNYSSQPLNCKHVLINQMTMASNS